MHLPGTPNANGSGYDPATTPQSTQDLVEELNGFPNASHDDQVDALAQALIYMSDHGVPRLRVLTAPTPRGPYFPYW